MKRIKSITTYAFHPSDEKFEEGFKSSFLQYNEVGNVIESVTYTSDDEIETKTITYYNTQGFKVEEQNFTGDELAEHYRFTYNISGQVLEENIDYFDGSSLKKVFERGSDTTTVTHFDDEGEIEEKEVYKTDSQGHILEKLIYDEDNKLKEKLNNEYDEHGNLVHRMEYGRNNEFISESKLLYDEQNNLLQRLNLNRKGELIEYLKVEYDERNRIVEQKLSNRYTIKFEYDDENKTSKEQRYLWNGTLEFEQISRYNEDNYIEWEENMNTNVKYEYEFFD